MDKFVLKRCDRGIHCTFFGFFVSKWRGSLNFRAPRFLPILTSSEFVPKKGCQ